SKLWRRGVVCSLQIPLFVSRVDKIVILNLWVHPERSRYIQGQAPFVWVPSLQGSEIDSAPLNVEEVNIDALIRQASQHGKETARPSPERLRRPSRSNRQIKSFACRSKIQFDIAQDAKSRQIRAHHANLLQRENLAGGKIEDALPQNRTQHGLRLKLNVSQKGFVDSIPMLERCAQVAIQKVESGQEIVPIRVLRVKAKSSMKQ